MGWSAGSIRNETRFDKYSALYDLVLMLLLPNCCCQISRQCDIDDIDTRSNACKCFVENWGLVFVRFWALWFQCLHALGEWSKLERLSAEKWPTGNANTKHNRRILFDFFFIYRRLLADSATRRRIAPLSAAGEMIAFVGFVGFKKCH